MRTIAYPIAYIVCRQVTQRHISHSALSYNLTAAKL